MMKAIMAAVVVLFAGGVGAAAWAGPIYVESFGSYGTGDGQFNQPQGITVDSVGDVYVTDTGNNRIQKLTLSNGSLAHTWSFGSSGGNNGQFNSPRGVAVDSAGNVYVADTLNLRIQKFSQSGGTVSHVWSFRGHLARPEGIAVDSVGNVYVTDTWYYGIVKLSQSGGTVSTIWELWNYGTGNGQFISPVGVAVDSAGNLYVSDTNRIQKLTQTGGLPLAYQWSIDGTSGNSVALDSAGNIYSAGGGTTDKNGRKFSQSGGTVATVWSLEYSNSHFNTFVAVDSAGNVYGLDSSRANINRWFDIDGLPAGQTATFVNLTLWADPALGSSLTLDSGRILHVLDTMTVEGGRTLTVSSATVDAGRVVIATGGVLSVMGTVNGPVACGPGGEINVAGDASLGDTTKYDGFTYDGALSVGTHTVTLHAKGFVNLGVITEIAGGTLAAPNGVVIGPGRALAGSGTVAAKVSAGFGSTIEATGDLALGDAASYDGFYSDGSLLTGNHTVTINDKNMAVLGSLTTLGDGASGGTLTAGNAAPADAYAHFLLEQGKNMVGRGSVNGNFKNHGDVIGDGVAAAERIIFNSPWTVSGKGTFTNTLIMGTFAPGDSPTISNGANQAFGGPVQIELGGTTPGSGNDNHDQVNDSASILLLGSSTLEILPWNSFVPVRGDEFVVLTWQAGLDGEFGDVVTASWFTDRDISFILHYNNVGGAGNLTIEAVPEPATLSLLALLALSLPKRGGLAMLRRRRRCMA